VSRALLDINVLIALLDLDHVHHRKARSWLWEKVDSGWASCPLTENGCVRIMSQPKYPNPVRPGEVIKRLKDAAATSYHEFWPDDLSILDQSVVDHTRIHGPKQVTDVYLLALAVKRGGRYVTFDDAVSLSSVLAAKKEHLTVI
jgi:toxin-antitoxin system PIN domain toxin